MIPSRDVIETYYRVYKAKYVLCIDFDHTLCNSDYPKCGDEIKPICDYIRYIQQTPYMEIILWTCRSGDTLIDAIKWCKEHGITIHQVNRQGYFDDTLYTESRKVFCNCLIDDTSYSFDIKDFEEFNEKNKIGE